MANELNKNQAEFLSSSIRQWQLQGLIDEPTAQKLLNSYQTKHFQWKRVAQYSFWLAVVSGVVAVGSLFISQQFLNLLRQLYYTPNIVIAFLSLFGALVCYYYTWRKRSTRTGTTLSLEALLLSALLLTANALIYFTRAALLPPAIYGLILALAGIVYGFVAVSFQSTMAWVFAMLSLYTGYFTQTTGAGRSIQFHGLNVICQAIIFAVFLLLSSALLFRRPKLAAFAPVTYIFNLSVFFISVWMLSVFGNTLSLEQWLGQRQVHMLGWAISATSLCVILLAVGIYKRNDYLQNFSIVFLIINLYTRYFELLYNSLNKALFFTVLAASFWLLGRWAEKHWKKTKTLD